MNNRLRILVILLLGAAPALQAQEWTEVQAPVELVFDSWVTPVSPAVHGLVTDRNDRLWVCRFAAGRLQVFNADGTEASFSPVDTVAEASTNTGNCRGINTDQNGDIIVVLQNSKVVRLNADDASYIDHWVGAGSLTRPAVDQDGYVYIAPVIGPEPTSAIHVLELPSYTEALTIQDDGTAWWGRAIDVSDDGLRLVSGRIFGGIGAYVFESEDATTYTLTDTLKGFEGDGSTVHLLTKDVLWATDEGTSADDQLLSTRNLKVFNFANDTYYVLRHDSVEIRPRGIAFADDGNTVFVGSFFTGRVAKFTLQEVVVGSEGPGEAPAFALNQSYPNPFKASTKIEYRLNKPATVTLRVYDVMGRLVTTLVDGQMQAAGPQEVKWDGRNAAGLEVGTGTYFYTLDADGRRETRSVVVLR